jgi:hypothetical protein
LALELVGYTTRPYGVITYDEIEGSVFFQNGHNYLVKYTEP